MNGAYWMNLALVAVGGAIGSVGRWAAGVWILERFGPTGGWSWPTFAVNIVGSFLIGVVAGLAETGALGVGPTMRLFLAIGILGGFTTFSSFALELLRTLEHGRALLGLGYALASVIFGVMAAYGGMVLAKLAR